jgi:hypothetical protein
MSKSKLIHIVKNDPLRRNHARALFCAADYGHAPDTIHHVYHVAKEVDRSSSRVAQIHIQYPNLQSRSKLDPRLHWEDRQRSAMEQTGGKESINRWSHGKYLPLGEKLVLWI